VEQHQDSPTEVLRHDTAVILPHLPCKHLWQLAAVAQGSMGFVPVMSHSLAWQELKAAQYGQEKGILIA
jgi:hypothetical protein